MMKRFKKLLSALCMIALLVSSMATVFANGDNDAETSAPQDTVIETKAEENAGTEDAVPETAPVQETASAPEANPVQAGASATEEADAASAAPAAEEASEKENTGDEDAAPAQGEDPAAQTASVPEDTSDLNAAPVQDDTSAANKDEQEDEESVVTADINPDEDYDELANEPVNFSEEDLVELDDGAGYFDPEYIEEHIGEITPEMKYENITELKIGSTVTGSAGADEIYYYIRSDKTQSIVLVLQAAGNVNVRINERAANFTEYEDGIRIYEMKVQSGDTCIIGVSGQGTFRLSAEAKAIEEEAYEEEEEEEAEEQAEDQGNATASEDEAAEEIAENTECTAPAADEAEENAEAETENTENNEGETEPAETPAEGTEEAAESAEQGTDEAEQNESAEPENVQGSDEETADKPADEDTEDTEETVKEETEPAIITWVTATVNEEDGTVTVFANANIELDNQIVWQTRTADSDEWKKAGYGLKLTVEVTEENADNFFRFKWADGDFSPEYQIHATVKTAEEETGDVPEENAEATEPEQETEATEETESTEEAAEGTETEEETVSEESAYIVEETASEEAVEGGKETVEEPAEGAEEAEKEPTESEEEADSEAEVTEETTEAEEEANAEEDKVEEKAKTEEETEEGTEAEETSEEDADADSEEETEEEAEEETEDETEEAEETESLTEEQLTELGYRKIQIMNQNGTDIYDGITEDAAVIGNVATGTELWIRDTESEEWAEIYTEDESLQFIKLADTEKQPLTDEEMLAMGYVKVFVGMDIGANVYNALLGDDPADHFDTGTELWVKLIDGADRAGIYDEEKEEISGYINLVDIIATKKPEGMEELPTRELVMHSNLEGSMVTKLFVGAEVHLWVDLINFREDDRYEVMWQYSPDGEEYIDIPDADKLEFAFTVDMENGNYIWKVITKLISSQE